MTQLKVNPDSDKPTYPLGRPKFYAQKFARTLGKLCIANEIGADACWFATTIACVEDAKQYAGPVNFFNHQLMPIVGQTRDATFRKVRDRLRERGILHTEERPNGSRQSTLYWTLLPPEYPYLDVGAIDEPVQSEDFQRGFAAGYQAAIDAMSVQTPRTKPTIEAPTLAPIVAPIEAHMEAPIEATTLLTYPVPVPSTDPKTPFNPPEGEVLVLNSEPRANSRKSAKPKFSEEQIEAVYRAYPRPKNPEDAKRAIAKLAGRIEFAELLQIVRIYAAARSGQNPDFTPYPATWFNAGSWQEDPATWKQSAGGFKFNAGSNRPPLNNGPGSTYDPTAAERDPNYGRM